MIKWEIKLKRMMAGPGGIIHPGETTIIDEVIARHLIETGQAELVSKPEPIIEQAVIPSTMETATLIPPPKTRKRR